MILWAKIRSLEEGVKSEAVGQGFRTVSGWSVSYMRSQDLAWPQVKQKSSANYGTRGKRVQSGVVGWF